MRCGLLHLHPTCSTAVPNRVSGRTIETCNIKMEPTNCFELQSSFLAGHLSKCFPMTVSVKVSVINDRFGKP